jgi:hypothetical protein
MLMPPVLAFVQLPCTSSQALHRGQTIATAHRNLGQRETPLHTLSGFSAATGDPGSRGMAENPGFTPCLYILMEIWPKGIRCSGKVRGLTRPSRTHQASSPYAPSDLSGPYSTFPGPPRPHQVPPGSSRPPRLLYISPEAQGPLRPTRPPQAPSGPNHQAEDAQWKQVWLHQRLEKHCPRKLKPQHLSLGLPPHITSHTGYF